MKFIPVEKFLEQSSKVQKCLIDWWNCDDGDIFVKKSDYLENKSSADIMCVNLSLENDLNGDWGYLKESVYPLFTEDLLKRYICDRVNCSICEVVIVDRCATLVKGVSKDTLKPYICLDCTVPVGDVL